MYVWKVTLKLNKRDGDGDEIADDTNVLSSDIVEVFAWAQRKALDTKYAGIVGIKCISDDLEVI